MRFRCVRVRILGSFLSPNNQIFVPSLLHRACMDIIEWSGDLNSLSAEVGSMELQEVPLLSDLFSIGQLVACTVRKLELVQEKKGRGKPEEGKNEKKGRRIELSLKLNYLYDGLSIEAVHEGQVKLN